MNAFLASSLYSYPIQEVTHIAFYFPLLDYAQLCSGLTPQTWDIHMQDKLPIHSVPLTPKKIPLNDNLPCNVVPTPNSFPNHC